MNNENSSSITSNSIDEYCALNPNIEQGKKLLSSTPPVWNLIATWRKSLTLREMKRVAMRSNAPISWQSIRTKSEMILFLQEKVEECQEFLKTIRSFTFDEYLEMGDNNLQSSTMNSLRVQRLRKNKRRKQNSDDDNKGEATVEGGAKAMRENPLKLGVRPALEAAVHIIPSGSGVHLGRGLILTCAHCVTHDDDADGSEDEDEDDDDNDDNDNDEMKIGRAVELVNAKGQTFGSICIDACSSTDLALLQIEKETLETLTLNSLDVAKRGDDKNGTDIFALGNPCDIDLEVSTKDDQGQTKRSKNGFFPFHFSEGKLEKKISKEKAIKYGLGRQIHSAWTYWGHSGCPLVASIKKGDNTFSICIVGIHNSWDDRNGNRHGVRLDDIWSFICRKGLFTDN
jgi:hypothetical protein